MIKKPLTVPAPIYQELALLNRLPKTHEKVPLIKEDLIKRISGYKGEKRIAYTLSFLKKNQYCIFYGLRLSNEYAFQMDIVKVILQNNSYKTPTFFIFTFNWFHERNLLFFTRDF